jgi:hypothetical protein
VEGIGAYILSVVASALICGSVRTFFDKKGGSETLIRSVCGIYMAFVLIAPLKNVDFSVYSDYFAGFSEEAEAVVNRGEEIALSQQRKFIKERIEAYILDKAVSLGAEVSVSVTLSDTAPPKPIKISVKGAVSPYVKSVLKAYLKEQFGIPEEAQTWTQDNY